MFFKKKKVYKIKFNDATYDGKENKTILDSLLKGGADIRYNCGSGTCEQCQIEVLSGNVESDLESNKFLSCQCYPTSDIEIAQH